MDTNANSHQVLYFPKLELIQESLKMKKKQKIDKLMYMMIRANLIRKKRQSLISVIIAGKFLKMDLNSEDIRRKSILENPYNIKIRRDFKIKTISINSEDNTFKK